MVENEGAKNVSKYSCQIMKPYLESIKKNVLLDKSDVERKSQTNIINVI